LGYKIIQVGGAQDMFLAEHKKYNTASFLTASPVVTIMIYIYYFI
jgi:hypothetical protein